MPPTEINKLLSELSDVTKDPPDLRDMFYTPTLRPLARFCDLPRALRESALPVRDQTKVKNGEDTGTCTGQALANVIDILRYENFLDDEANAGKGYSRVSAGMIYSHGRDIEASEVAAPKEGLRSLRTAIKGFYHNGVCADSVWREKGKNAEEDQLKLINRYLDARTTPLGSYYRLQPILNDYHAALNEVGVIYCSAEIHDGWDELNVKSNNGEIRLPLPSDPEELYGAHAFAIVGYTPKGFLVLNSWGDQWGGVKVASANSSEKLEFSGVALWHYQDWAERVIDGWVLRLGVSAPEAFRFSFGRQGIADYVAGEIKAGSTPRHELIGHYIHIDDGKFVTKGSIPTDLKSISATCRLLKKRKEPTGEDAKIDKYQGILLWLAGGSGGSKDVLNQIAKTKEYWKQKRIYPITALWCSDLMDQAGAFLERIEQGAFELVRETGTNLNRRIELDARAIGRSVWRDIKRSAASAASADLWDNKNKDLPAGAMRAAYDLLADIQEKPLNLETPLHLVGEGVGAILLHRLMKDFGPVQFKALKSVSLIMPACSTKEFNEMKDWLQKWGLALNLFVASDGTSKRFRYGRYKGSLLDLAQMAFVENPPRRSMLSSKRGSTRAQQILRAGAEDELIGRLDKAAVKERFADVEAVEINLPGGADKIASLRDVSAGQEALNKIEKVIFGEQAKGDAPNVRTLTADKPQDQVRATARPALPAALAAAVKY